MVKLNKKEYSDTGVFKTHYIDEYCNLQIYPLVGLLEREAGLLSDLIEAYQPLNASVKVYGNENLEDIQFIKDNLPPDIGNSLYFYYIHDSFLDELPMVPEMVLSVENDKFNELFKIKFDWTPKVLYLNERAKGIFITHFKYYLTPEGSFVYNNLLCYCMIVKDAGPMLETVLTENLPFIDRWCILDTGSTDGTQDIIRKVLANKKGILYEEPFVDFKVSRNRCLELAGTGCKFNIMLDDTYIIRGDLVEFLNTTRGDQFSDSFSMLIQSDDTEYYSNRIIKSTTGLRYIHRIHEVITDQNNVNVTVPPNKAVIFDKRADYMEKRTNNRKQFDLELLKKELKDFPDDPRALYYMAQTYGCIGDEINKALYFEKRIDHPVEGYFQEKIDACFELARTYNFKINPFTLKEYPVGVGSSVALPLKEWKVCEKLYLQAYSLDRKRPDSLYFIGINYYLQGDTQMAYKYFKKAFVVGYPVFSQYSLKPTLSFHFLPKFLTEICYTVGDFRLGEECSKLFLQSPKYNNPSSDSWRLMSSWYQIHNQLNKMPPLSLSPTTMDKPIFCIVTDGGWENWTGEDLLTKGLGGSETWVVEMARNLVGYYVVVFCKTDKPRFFENVGYNPIEYFHSFISSTVVEVCIISRYTEYVPVAIHGHAKNIGIIFHDNLMPEMVIPMNPKIKWVWGLTEWHSTIIKNVFPYFNVTHLNYGIDHSKFKVTTKVKHSFIYSSFPNRGLVVLLKMWPKIIKKWKDATLNIFCNLDQAWVNQVAPDMMNEIKKLLKINKTGITVHGWVPKDKLFEFWNKTEYFLYPCIFEETFCLTALEAAASRTCIIHNGLAALSETAKNGYSIPGDPNTPGWQDKALSVLFENHHDVENNWEYSKTLTWKGQAQKLMDQVSTVNI